MQTSILIRTFVADGRRLTLHVGGGITWQQRPGGRVGRDRRQGARPARRDRRDRGRVRPMAGPRHVWVDGRLLPADGAAPLGVRPRLPARRRRLRDAPGARRPSDRARRAPRPAAPVGGRPRHRRCPDDLDARDRDRDRATCWRPRASTAPDGDASVRITVSRGAVPRSRAAAARRGRRGRRSRSRPGPSSPPPADHLERGLHLVASARPARPAEPARGAQDDVARRLRLRAARGAPGRRRRRAVPDHRRPPVRGRRPRTSSSSGRQPTASRSSRRRRSTARSCPGTTRSWLLAWGARGRACGPSRAGSTAPTCAAADEAFLSLERGRDPAGDAVRRRADRRRACPGRGRGAPAPTARR